MIVSTLALSIFALVIAILAFVLGYLVGKHYTDKKYKKQISNALTTETEHKPNPVKFLQTFEEVLNDVDDENDDNLDYQQRLKEPFTGDLDLSGDTYFRHTVK